MLERGSFFTVKQTFPRSGGSRLPCGLRNGSGQSKRDAPLKHAATLHLHLRSDRADPLLRLLFPRTVRQGSQGNRDPAVAGPTARHLGSRLGEPGVHTSCLRTVTPPDPSLQPRASDIQPRADSSTGHASHHCRSERPRGWPATTPGQDGRPHHNDADALATCSSSGDPLRLHREGPGLRGDADAHRLRPVCPTGGIGCVDAQRARSRSRHPPENSRSSGPLRRSPVRCRSAGLPGIPSRRIAPRASSSRRSGHRRLALRKHQRHPELPVNRCNPRIRSTGPARDAAGPSRQMSTCLSAGNTAHTARDH